MKSENILKAVLAIVAIVVVGFGIAKITDSVFSDNPAGQPAKTINAAQDGPVREIYITASQWKFSENEIRVKKGERVRIIAESADVPHGFAIDELGVSAYLDGVRKQVIEFVAERPGTYVFYCNVPCGSGHSNMKGKIIVA